MKHNPDRRHFLYRCFDATDRLVYIGATSDLEQRMTEYANPARGIARWAVEEHPTRAAAFAAERAAIKAERPLWNIQGCGMTPQSITKEESPMTLDPDYTLEEVAKALGMSTRWIRDRVNKDNAEHIRYGHKIRFTAEQVEKLRASHTKAPIAVESITTGRKRKAS